MIEISNLQKSFGTGIARRTVIDRLDACFEPGKLNFVVGPSGCGKTTLIGLAGAMLNPDAGRISLFGNDITTMDKTALSDFRSREIGFMFQQFHLFGKLSAVENVCTGLLPLGVSWKEARKRALPLLEALEMAEFADLRCGALSSGQQQRLALARALVKSPKILFCDEPTASLDPEAGCNVLEMIREIALTRNRVVVIVSHDTRIFHMADCIFEMNLGKLKRR